MSALSAALDASRQAIRQGKVILPRGGGVVREFAEHMAADVQQLVEDEDTGARSFRYVKTGTNHYSLAFTYECIAATRCHPVDWSMYGWLPRPLDPEQDLMAIKF